MPLHSPLDLSSLAGELDRLLAAGQAPIIGQRLRAALLTEVRIRAPETWPVYGFRVALDLAENLMESPPRDVSPDVIAEFEGILAWCGAQEIPPIQGAERWPSAARGARDALETARGNPERAPHQEATPSSSSATQDSDEDAPEAGVNIPAVVRVERANPRFPLFAEIPPVGQLVRLFVRAHVRLFAKDGPHLSVDKDREKATREAFQACLPALRALRPPGAPRLEKCGFEVSWDAAGGRLGGESASLGFLLAAAAAWSKLSPAPVARMPSPRLAATGRMSGESIASVEGIAEKAAACFHGPIDVLIVPRECRETALEIVRRLEQSYPERQLLVRGAGSIDEAWNDAGAVLSLHRPMASLARTGMLRLLSSRLGLGLVLLAIAGVASWWVRELHLSRPVPASAHFSENELIVRNPAGRDCWKYRFAVPPSMKVNADPTGLNLVLVDLNGDGLGEVAALHGSNSNSNDSLSVFDHRGRRLWTAYSRGIGNPADSLGLDLVWKAIYIVPRNGVQGQDLLVMRKSIQGSLTVLDLFRGNNGEPLGRLRNSGHLEGIFVLDIGNDGTTDFLAYGGENPTTDGLLARIDPVGMSTNPPPNPGSLPPWIMDPTSLRSGVAWAVRFVKDIHCPWPRTHVEFPTTDPPDLVTVPLFGVKPNYSVLYKLRVTSPNEVRLEDVEFTDAYKTAVHWIRGPGELGGQDAERCRLANEVRVLRPTGWQKLASIPGGVSESPCDGR